MVLVAVQTICWPGASVVGAAGVQLSADKPVKPVSVMRTSLSVLVPLLVPVKV